MLVMPRSNFFIPALLWLSLAVVTVRYENKHLTCVPLYHTLTRKWHYLTHHALEYTTHPTYKSIHHTHHTHTHTHSLSSVTTQLEERNTMCVLTGTKAVVAKVARTEDSTM